MCHVEQTITLDLRLTHLRPYWRCYYANTHAIIYVIDSSDHDRLQTSRAELLTMLAEEELKGVPVLVFSNKQVRAEALFEDASFNETLF